MTASVFLDTSVLVAGLVDLGPPSAFAQRIMDRIARGSLRHPSTAWHCCLEFYAVTTRLPEEFRLPPSDALRLVEEEILDRFQVHHLPKETWRTFLHDSEKERVVGGRLYDFHIAEIARLTGAGTVVTDNLRHFTLLRRHGIRVTTAQEFADRMRKQE